LVDDREHCHSSRRRTAALVGTVGCEGAGDVSSVVVANVDVSTPAAVALDPHLGRTMTGFGGGGAVGVGRWRFWL
jgi:hypothetical protein